MGTLEAYYKYKNQNVNRNLVAPYRTLTNPVLVTIDGPLPMDSYNFRTSFPTGPSRRLR